MGIYGALATAVTGLSAQSFALENISGNIANSQTTGYKRMETTFVDLIPDAPVKSQVPGAVIGQSRSTNSDKGDIVSSSSDTHMALNGSGFFVVEEKIGQNDGNAVFGGADYYTRRGDFDVDKEGYLVNGAGYYLKGLPIDASTGNVSGSVPEVIQLSNDFLPAERTNRVDYKLNLPEIPKNAGYDPANPGSELMFAPDYANGSVISEAVATGTGGGYAAGDTWGTHFADGDTLSLSVDGQEVTFEIDNDGNTTTGNNVIDVTDPNYDELGEILGRMQTDIQALGGDFSSATVGLNGGNVEIALGTGATSSITVGGDGGPAALGLAPGIYQPDVTQVSSIQANENDEFLSNSIAGGAVTVYASNGSPVDVQLRWAKTDSAETGGQDTWNLFYLSNGNATGSTPMWQNTGQDYMFDAAGSLTPNVSELNLSNLTVNGTNVGDVTLRHNTGGVTQFADPNGTAQVTTLTQNGFPAGEFVSVTVNDSGRVVASYSNGEKLELAQVVVANFNSPNGLKRMDGGLFSATSESGEAVIESNASIVGGSLESSNTDISEEFTKLITTQQAYAAGTRIVSTSDEMLQEALNMLR